MVKKTIHKNGPVLLRYCPYLGDRINATIYAVLSQSRTFEFEALVDPQVKLNTEQALNFVEGCYDSYHTLQADNLWRDMRSVDELNGLVLSWMLTLEKQVYRVSVCFLNRKLINDFMFTQGCHNLVKAGASGVIQAMVLSLGGLRFSNQHLELNIHPRYLHRDYLYR